jgi:hypothetical protein
VYQRGPATALAAFPEVEPDYYNLVCMAHPRKDKLVLACVDEDDLNNTDRLTIYNILAATERRLESQARARAEAEKARIAKCTVPLLRIGCPAK